MQLDLFDQLWNNYSWRKEINGPGVDREWYFNKELFEWLTVAENVNFGLRMKDKDPIETEKVDEWLDSWITRFWKYSYISIIWWYATRSGFGQMFNQ